MRFLGTNEYMVMLAIVHLGSDAYGAAIVELLGKITGRAPSSGSLSTTLDRMEAKRLVVSRYEPGADSRGGRPRRVVALTVAGEAELEATDQALRRLRRNQALREGTG